MVTVNDTNVNICQDSLAINESGPMTKSVILSESEKLKFIFRTLFEKCLFKQEQYKSDSLQSLSSSSASNFNINSEHNTSNSNSNNTTTTSNNNNNNSTIINTCLSYLNSNLEDNNSYICCNDVIEYFNQDIINNQLMSNNQNISNEAVEQLKDLFYEHFNITAKNDSLLKDCKLDFKSFNDLLYKWINQLKSNESFDLNGQNGSSNLRKSSNAYYCLKKLHLKHSSINTGSHLTDLTTENYFSSLLSHNDDDNSGFSWSRSSSSIRSLSFSDNELNNNSLEFDQHIEYNLTKNQTDVTYQDRNQIKQEIFDLKTENKQLKQTIFDLKSQLQNAEETNTQLAADCELETKKTNELNKLIQDINLKLVFFKNENEQLRKLIEQLRIKETYLLNENSNLNISMKEKETQINRYEYQLNKMNSKLLLADCDLDKIKHELNLEKESKKEIQINCSYIEQQLVQLSTKLAKEEDLNEKLHKKIKDLKLENDSLFQQINDFESKFRISLNRLFAKPILKKQDSQLQNELVTLKSPTKQKQNHQLLINDIEFSESESSFELITNLNDDNNDNNNNNNTNLNTNSFKIKLSSPVNEKTFFFEQFEYESKNKSDKSNLENLIDYFQDYLCILDQIKQQYDTLKYLDFNIKNRNNNSIKNNNKENKKDKNLINSDKSNDLDHNKNTNDNNNTNINDDDDDEDYDDFDSSYVNTNFKRTLENLFFYFFNDKNENSLSLKDRLQILIEESKSLINKYNTLSNNFKNASNLINLYKKTSLTLNLKTNNCYNNKPKLNRSITTTSDRPNSLSITSQANSNLTDQKNNSKSIELFKTTDWSKIKDLNTKNNTHINDTNILSSIYFNVAKNSSAQDKTNENKLIDQSCSSNRSILVDTNINNDNNRSNITEKEINCNHKTMNISTESFDRSLTSNKTDEPLNCPIDKEYSNQNKNNFFSKSQQEPLKLNIITGKSTNQSNSKFIMEEENSKENDKTENIKIIQNNFNHQINIQSNLNCTSSYKHYLDRSLSLPNLLDIDVIRKIQTLKIKQNNVLGFEFKEVATQTLTHLDSEDLDENSIESDLSKPMNKKSLLLKHQLTRDSGIDSDNPQQIALNFKKSSETVPEMENTDVSNKTTDKESTMKVVKKAINKSLFITSSTRDNSIDQEMSSIEDVAFLENEDYKINEMDNQDENLENSFDLANNKKSTRRSFDGPASSRRQMFKNTSTKHNTIDVPSLLRRPDHMNLPVKVQESLDLEPEDYKKHLEHIESTQPTINFTGLSKISTEIKETTNEDIKSACKLNIDDILNIQELPSPSTQSNKMGSSDLMKNRDKFKHPFRNRQDSICLTDQSSFDECSQTQAENLALIEHKIKLLESNFNQIIMAQNSDEKLVQLCLDKYKDKFQKTDQYINVLFEEILNLLSKVVNCLNDLPFKNQNNERLSFDDNDDEQSQQILLTKKNKKYLQDNLNNLNKTISLLRKNMINLIITSSMIGGLKQESHLGDLIKVSISYVKELKRSFTNSNKNANINTVNTQLKRLSHPSHQMPNSISLSSIGSDLSNKSLSHKRHSTPIKPDETLKPLIKQKKEEIGLRQCQL